MAKSSKGPRQGSRTVTRRSKSDRGRIFIRRAMHPYKEGDSVAIAIDGSQQRGMPHRRFQGRTGKIQSKQGRAYVIAVKDGNMPKTLVCRPEHLRPVE